MLEKIVANNSTTFLEFNYFIPETQHGINSKLYTALLKFTNKIHDNIHKTQINIFTF